MRLDQLFFAAFGGARGATGAEAGLSVAEQPRRSRWGVLELPDFRRLWMVGLVAFGVRWLEILVVGVFVYQRTGSAFAVALMTMLRSLPMALFGALIGALADRVERKKALVGVVKPTPLLNVRHCHTERLAPDTAVDRTPAAHPAPQRSDGVGPGDQPVADQRLGPGPRRGCCLPAAGHKSVYPARATP